MQKPPLQSALVLHWGPNGASAAFGASTPPSEGFWGMSVLPPLSPCQVISEEQPAHRDAAHNTTMSRDNIFFMMQALYHDRSRKLIKPVGADTLFSLT